MKKQKEKDDDAEFWAEMEKDQRRTDIILFVVISMIIIVVITSIVTIFLEEKTTSKKDLFCKEKFGSTFSKSNQWNSNGIKCIGVENNNLITKYISNEEWEARR